MLYRQLRRSSARSRNRWQRSPVLAGAVRLLALAAPVVVAFLVIRAIGGYLFRPPGWAGLIVWMVQATVIAFAISVATDRYTRRLSPLVYLLNLSLVFPDEAPSRFGVALRSGSVRRMTERLSDSVELGATEDEAAQTALALVAALGKHDRRTRGHTDRVRAYSDLIADELGLSQDDRDKLAWGVLLHDLGKLLVPAEILNKAEPLSEAEWTVLSRHPAVGGRMLESLEPWLGEWVLAARDHHERWDGLGYPAGLAGEEISLAGRITAVADAYDVITSNRSYTEAMSGEAARSELVACAGSQFDPEVVRAMLNASLGHRWSFGPLAWLADLPIGQATATITATPLVAAVGTVAAVGGAIDVPQHPSELAFAADAAVVDGELATTAAVDPAPRSESDDLASPTPTPTPAPSAATATSPTTPGPTSPLSSSTTTTTSPPPSAPLTTASPTTASPTTASPTTDSSATAAPTTSPATASPSTTSPSTTSPATAAPTTAAPTTTVIELPPLGQVWYLKNGGVGDTESQLFKQLANDGPDNAIQPNYDTNTDARAGLRLLGTPVGFNEARASHHQRFGLDAASLTMSGSPVLTVYAAVDPEGGTEPAQLQVAISECGGLYIFCTDIATGTATVTTSADDGFQKITIDFGAVDHTFSQFGVLVVRMITDDGRVLQTAFDSNANPSALVARLD